MNDDDPILIVLLPRPSDLDRARQGFYRMPMRHAPAALASARALAFYQPSTFGADGRWTVAWWAPVRALGQQRRRALISDEADHPRADEWYAVVELGDLQPLEPPLRASRGRRLLYVPARWGALRRSSSLDELLAGQPRPIADSLLYTLIQQQLESDGLTAAPAQPRLFEDEELAAWAWADDEEEDGA